MIKPGMRMPPADESRAVTDEYIKAVNLNRRIITAAQLAQQSLYEMCTGFKKMRDSKLYKELGYTEFNDYCMSEVGFSDRQAYRMISIAEKLPKDLVTSMSLNCATKLSLLTSLSEEERAEIVENTDLESASVRELEQQIKQLKADKDKAVAERSAAEAESAAREDTVKALEKTKLELEKRITALEADIKQLEERPVEVAVQQSEKIPKDHVALSAYEKMVNEYNERIETLEAENLEQIRAAHSEKTELEARLAEVQKQLDAAKNAPAEIDTDGVFKAYFETAYNAMNALVKYAQDHKEYSEKVCGLVDVIKNSLTICESACANGA